MRRTLGTVENTPCDLMRIIRARRLELGIPGAVLDEAAGLPDRYVSKLEAGVKNLGRLSLPLLLEALGLRLVVIADDATLPASTKRFVGTMRPRVHSEIDSPGIHDGAEL